MSSSQTQHRVLVVDDEPSLAELVTMALRFEGFEVQSAGTGRDALAAVTAFKPHLIVLDAPRSAHVAYRVGAAVVRHVLCD